MTERYDPRGFKAKCIGCGKPFYIPWETMCDAGYCDACMKKKPNWEPHVMTQPESDRERIDGDIQLTAFFLQAHPDADIEAVLGTLVKPLLERAQHAEAALLSLQRAAESTRRECLCGAALSLLPDPAGTTP